MENLEAQRVLGVESTQEALKIAAQIAGVTRQAINAEVEALFAENQGFLKAWQRISEDTELSAGEKDIIFRAIRTDLSGFKLIVLENPEISALEISAIYLQTGGAN